MPTAKIRMEGVGTFTLQSRTELRTPAWQDALARAREEGRKSGASGTAPRPGCFR